MQGEDFQRSREPAVPSAQVQSNTQSNDPINILSTPDCSLLDVLSILDELPILKDLDTPIAIRKGASLALVIPFQNIFPIW